ncbi:MAG: L-serine ammonia-lyase, iron-sulfur-dependent, subunit alpha [Schwartzia sp. (in: firmicutes)]
MIRFETMADLVNLAEEKAVPLSEIVIQSEAENTQQSRFAVLVAMEENWAVMKEAIHRGVTNRERSVSGLTGGDAAKIFAYQREGGYLGPAALAAAAYAVGVSEVNASMGRIVACPTAGSCGIVPAVLYTAMKQGIAEQAIISALFTAAGVGMIVEANASISGAAGGCQAECGTAAGMAAAALVEVGGGSPEDVAHGAALAMKNLLGLVCDPVAGLVEVPCVKRNGFAAVHAMLAADMALAGVRSVIPVDEVIEAMDHIGRALPKSLKETADGGLAASKTAQRIVRDVYGEEK